ncbi:MAG: type II toxin-antitoxin system PemK/MazF family toxin [Euzebya sp.]
MIGPEMASMGVEPTHYRGEVWLVDFGQHPEGPEQAFHRPAVIVSDDRLHHPNLRMVIVVPGTSTLRGLPLHVRVENDAENGLTQSTGFQVEQVRAISTGRLMVRLGRLDPQDRHTIDEVLRNTLSLR